MGAHGDPHEEHPDNKAVQHEGWSDFREKPRSCTDSICMLLLIAVWVGMTFVGLVVLGAIHDEHLKAGNPYRLTNPIDYNGHICGYTEGVKDLKVGYYLPDLSVVCVDKCPSSNAYDEFVCHYDVQSSADASVSAGYDYVNSFSCMYKIKTRKFVNRCFPDTDTLAAANDAVAYAATYSVAVNASQATYSTSSESNSGWFSNFLSDVVELSSSIGGFGLGVATLVSFLYLYLLRIPGLLKVLIWGIIVGTFVCIIVGSFLLWDLSNSWAKDGLHSDPEVVTMRVFAYTGMGVCALYFCLMVVLRRRVNLAIGIVKQAARALASMPTLLLVPLLQAVGFVTFLVPWVIYLTFLASSGDMTTVTASYEYNGAQVDYTYRTFQYTDSARFTFLYLLFCWFWTSEFIVAFGQLVISMAFTAWYFNRDKSQTGASTVAWAFGATAWYHSGTAAFGSLVIAIIMSLRAIFAYIQRKARKTRNKALEFVACILGCIMWCLEKVMRFINKHAYVMTAVYGHSFCRAARTGFFLILRNVLRVSAVNMVASFLLLIGRVFVPVLTTFLCYLTIAYGTNGHNISGLVAPLVFTFLLAFWVSSMFLEIFGMGIETILCCFIADEEMFPVEQRFAEGDLGEVCTATHEEVQRLKKKALEQPPSQVPVPPIPASAQYELIASTAADTAKI